MKILQIAFIAVMGAACFATFATSETLHAQCEIAEQDSNPAPQSC